MKILVSACLLGLDTRYAGDNCRNEKVLALAKEHTLIPVCPEQMGGLATPRDPAEIRGDRVVTRAGRDVTGEYEKGAEAALRVAELNSVDLAILKAKSPSCGKGLIYDGTFTGGKCPGNGKACRLLMEHGIRVVTEDEI